jgi:serine/threonine protein kinase
MKNILRNRYEIKRELGQGGMGKTFLAYDHKLQKEVVVKILGLKATDEWKTVELFEREAKTLKNIEHPFIPDYIDYFTQSKDGDTEYYLVQEYIAGKNLKKLIEDGKRFKEEQVLEIAEKLLAILVDLQKLNPPVVHRDINPKNIILNEKGDIYLVDFGAVQGVVKSAAMGSSTVVGTYGYMPVEQMMGKACPASDIYAAGITLIYILSHNNPEALPIKNMKVVYKDSVKLDPRYFILLDKMIEPDLARRLPDAQSALKMLAKLKQGKVADAGQFDAIIDLHNLLPPFKSNIKFVKRGDELSLIIRGKIAHNFFLLGFDIMWLAFITIWTRFMFEAPYFFGVVMCLFSIPFWLVGLFLLYKVIDGFSKSNVCLTKEFISIKRGMLTPKIKLPIEYINNVTIKEIQKTQQTQKNYLQMPIAYGIIIESGAKNIVIDKFLTKTEAQWVVQVIEKYKQLYT